MLDDNYLPALQADLQRVKHPFRDQAQTHARLVVVMATCLAFLLLTTGSATANVLLTFGIYAADKPSETVRKFRPLLNALEAKLSQELGESVNIRTQIANSYYQAIQELTKGEVDFVRFGPASYITAKQGNPNVKLLAIESVKGKNFFYGIICVQENSNIKSLTDLRGLTFAFGDRLSTIGRFLSQAALLKANIRAADLKRFDYLGRHDRVGTAVGRGQYHAGALKENTFTKLRKKGVPIRKLISFQNITKPWIAREGLSARIITAIRSALLTMNDPKALKAIKKSGFLETNDSDFDIIRQAMKRSKQFGG